MNSLESTPFVVGQWVRGAQFYGRKALIDTILEGPRRTVWVLGNRRVGKTSLLKELERLTVERDEDVTPLYWDLQGCETPADFASSLGEAVLDGGDELPKDALQGDDTEDVVAMLRTLRRRIAARGRRLLLLCDEAEALLALANAEPRFINALGKALRNEDLRCVMASTIRLWSLAGDHPGFLHDFLPPLYLGAMEPDAASDLVRQSRLEPDSRPAFEPRLIAEILERTGRHPYLLQLLAMKVHLSQDLEDATRQLLFDSMVSHFLTVDFEALTQDEQAILRFLATSPSAGTKLEELRLPEGSPPEPCLIRLAQLGFIERAEEGHRFTSIFFRQWLRVAEPERREPDEPATDDGDASLRVGSWIVEPESNVIRQGSDEVRLEPRVMNLLVHLASRPGLVTSKDQIVDAVWDGAFISESALTRTIADLRKALGDDARSPRYIETISKRGYRLVAEVSGGSPDAVSAHSRFSLVWNGRAHPLSSREFVLGRDPHCTMCLSSGNVSRRHARIVSTGQAATIEDLGSRNGTRVNGARITAPRLLADGDEIHVGTETLVFRDGSSPAITNVDPATTSKGGAR
jgi:DNA-binding winged helix-turn-helix (wHTH) protein